MIMKNESKKYSLKDIFFTLWIVFALLQVHIGLFLWLGIDNPILFLFFHGLLMGIEGIFVGIIVYA